MIDAKVGKAGADTARDLPRIDQLGRRISPQPTATAGTSQPLRRRERRVEVASETVALCDGNELRLAVEPGGKLSFRRFYTRPDGDRRASEHGLDVRTSDGAAIVAALLALARS